MTIGRLESYIAAGSAIRSNPARVACEFVFYRHSESTECAQCYTHVGVRAKLNQWARGMVLENGGDRRKVKTKIVC